MVTGSPDRSGARRGAALVPCAALFLAVLTSRDAPATHAACNELTFPGGCESRKQDCTSFFRAEFEADRAYCARTKDARRNRARCRQKYRRVFRDGRLQCAELFRNCKACCRSSGDKVCAAARRIECDVGCEVQGKAWKRTVGELHDGCRAIGDSLDHEDEKDHRKRCKEVSRENLRAVKLARKNCHDCCELGEHALSCQAPPVLCGDDAVGGEETCDGHDDAACPGRCAVECGCGSPSPAFMILTPGAL